MSNKIDTYYSLAVLKACLLKLSKDFTIAWLGVVVVFTVFFGTVNLVLIGALPAVYIFVAFLYQHIEKYAGPKYRLDEDELDELSELND